MEYYLAIKKNEILPFATTWLDPEDIMLSEISQSERQIPYDFTHVWNLRKKPKKKTDKTRQNKTKNSLLITENKLMVTRRGMCRGMGKIGEGD